MHQRIQYSEPVGPIENLRSQQLAVNAAGGIEDAGAELLDHARIGFPLRLQDLMSKTIRLNQMAPQILQSLADEALAARESSGEPYAEHNPSRRSADCTALTMSIAIVRGPTPPGTGVYAPAFSATSPGCTSPTRILPLRSKTCKRSGTLAKMRPASFGSEILFIPTSITVAPGLM